MKLAKRMVVAALSMTLWAAVAGYGVLAGWWHPTFAPAGDTKGFIAAARKMIAAEAHGDLAIALVAAGQIAEEHYVGKSGSVNRETVFPAASVSKWVTAVGVMQLVRQGKIDLDAPVAQYLTRWKFPASQFDLNGVTTRRLLSHTAGLTDGLGFGDYRLDEPLPTLEETLRSPRASAGKSAAIAVGEKPGSRWQYSGGGYLILQLLVEEVSQQPFAEFMRQVVLDPLGLSCSSFDSKPSPKAAGSYDVAGHVAERFQYAAAGATGFSTCIGDMVRWVQANVRKDAPTVMDAEIRRRMRQPHGHRFGIDIWGLGTMLYAPARSGAFLYGHDGNNHPAINAAVRINPDNGDAIVVLTTGGRLLATRLGSEWTYWQGGGPDFLVIGAALREALVPVVAGWFVMALIAAAVLVRSSGAGRQKHSHQ